MTDEIILRRLKQGDTKAFEILYNKYYYRVYCYICSFVRDPYEAENVLQDVFISFWEARHKILDTHQVDSLLYKIAKNKSLNTLRKEVNKKLYLKFLSDIKSDKDLSTELKINYDELEFFVKKFITNLPDRRREIFLCSYNEGLSYKEIAQKLSISENTVDTQIRNALEYIRENILKYFNLK